MDIAFTDLNRLNIKLDDFNCNEPELNDFIQNHATYYIEKGISAVKLLVDKETKSLLGYYAISPMSLEMRRLSPKLKDEYNRIKFPLPCWLIGKLAVSQKYQNLGLGAILLKRATEDILQRGGLGAGALIVVDAKNDTVKGFYTRFGFELLKADKLRLVLPMASLHSSMKSI